MSNFVKIAEELELKGLNGANNCEGERKKPEAGKDYPKNDNVSTAPYPAHQNNSCEVETKVSTPDAKEQLGQENRTHLKSLNYKCVNVIKLSMFFFSIVK